MHLVPSISLLWSTLEMSATFCYGKKGDERIPQRVLMQDSHWDKGMRGRERRGCGITDYSTALGKCMILELYLMILAGYNTDMRTTVFGDPAEL